MNKALVDSTQSQQAALLHQYHRLQDENVTSNTSHAPVMSSIMKTLQENSEVGMIVVTCLTVNPLSRTILICF